MAKEKSVSDGAKTTARQLNLFDEVAKACSNKELPVTGSANIQVQFKETVAQAMAASRLSRYEIAGAISNLLGQEVSKYQLDAWVAESKDCHRLPAEYLVAFCRVTGNYEPLKLICKELGLFVMSGPDALRSELQQIDEEIKGLQKEKDLRLDFLQMVQK